MIKVSLKRTPKETVVTVKTDVPGEKPFKFESLSPSITQINIRLILPMMLEQERDKRAKKAHRKNELAEIKVAKADRLARGDSDSEKKQQDSEEQSKKPTGTKSRSKSEEVDETQP